MLVWVLSLLRCDFMSSYRTQWESLRPLDVWVVWMRNAPHSLKPLYTWFPAGGAVWGDLGSVPCLRKCITGEGTGELRSLSRFICFVSRCVFSASYACCLLPTALLLWTILPWNHISQNTWCSITAAEDKLIQDPWENSTLVRPFD